MIIVIPKGKQSFSTTVCFIEAIVGEDHNEKQIVIVLKTRPWEEDALGFALKILGYSLVGRPLKSQLEALPTELLLGS